MEIIKNNHYEQRYGCICKKCKSVFVFNESETDTIQVICPVCKYSNRISECIKFLDKNTEENFKELFLDKPINIQGKEAKNTKNNLLYQLKRFYNSNTICFDIFIILFSILIICLICLIPK